jgi:hypothetical protein
MQKLQQQVEVTVDGEAYVVQLYGPTYGLRLWSKLLRLMGEPLVKLVSMFKNQKIGSAADIMGFDLSKLDTDAAASALQTLFAGLRDDEFPDLVKEILSSTYFKQGLSPVGDQFENHFSGRYLHLFKLVAKTLAVQYADFFAGLGKRKNAGAGGSASDQPKPKGVQG